MNDRPLRVVMLIESVSGGGAERFTVGLAEALAERGLDVAVCASRDRIPTTGAARTAGDLPVMALGRRRTLSPGPWLRLVRHLRREQVDVLHSHMFGSNVWAVALGRLGGVPVVIATEHSWTYEGDRLRKLLDGLWVGRLATAFVAVSPVDAHRMVEVERVPAAKVRTIPTGLLRDPDELRSSHGLLRDELGLPASTPLVGAVAMLRPMKAVDVLIRAFALVHERLPDTRLVVAGDGPLRPEIEELVETLGLGDHVHLLGVREDVPNVLRSLDVVVMPSDSEGSPIALIEAMVAERAIVASSVGGVPSMLGDCGILVPPRQPERFCDAIVSLLQRSDLRADYGRRAQRRALSRFTINSVAGEWESLYNELIARPRRWPAVRRATRIPRWRRHA